MSQVLRKSAGYAMQTITKIFQFASVSNSHWFNKNWFCKPRTKVMKRMCGLIDSAGTGKTAPQRGNPKERLF